LTVCATNPKGDWTIGNIERICHEYGMSCRPPSGGGSHYKISHPNVRDILTVPAAPADQAGVYSEVAANDRAGRKEMMETGYTVIIQRNDPDEGGGFLALVPDLPGCMSDGDTREEAAHNVSDAIEAWLEEAVRLGRQIPQPSKRVA
jgi:antitoxin HicB